MHNFKAHTHISSLLHILLTINYIADCTQMPFSISTSTQIVVPSCLDKVSSQSCSNQLSPKETADCYMTD